MGWILMKELESHTGLPLDIQRQSFKRLGKAGRSTMLQGLFQTFQEVFHVIEGFVITGC